eukprot:SAG22_NODE_17_length_32684_cov_34.234095_15_plen_196_part_00
MAIRSAARLHAPPVPLLPAELLRFDKNHCQSSKPQRQLPKFMLLVAGSLAALVGALRLSPAAAQTPTVTPPPAPPPGADECMSARSCEELQDQFADISGFPFKHGTDDVTVCAESDNGLGPGGATQCFTDSFEAARSICYEAGARLCTIDEILFGATGNTGCNLVRACNVAIASAVATLLCPRRSACAVHAVPDS